MQTARLPPELSTALEKLPKLNKLSYHTSQWSGCDMMGIGVRLQEASLKSLHIKGSVLHIAYFWET